MLICALSGTLGSGDLMTFSTVPDRVVLGGLSVSESVCLLMERSEDDYGAMLPNTKDLSNTARNRQEIPRLD
jgi:hypothetical protein